MDGCEHVGYDAAMHPHDSGAQTSQQPSPLATQGRAPRPGYQSSIPAAPAHDAGPDELASLLQRFPGFRIWREITRGRVRYVARSRRPGLNPHTVVTADIGELWAALGSSRDAGLVPTAWTSFSSRIQHPRSANLVPRGSQKYIRVDRPGISETTQVRCPSGLTLEVKDKPKVKVQVHRWLLPRALATNVPRPWTTSTRCSSASALVAWRTVTRLTPYCPASSCSAGRRAPAARRPSVMSARRSSATCCQSGRAAS
jgi:hypothetical protein